MRAAIAVLFFAVATFAVNLQDHHAIGAASGLSLAEIHTINTMKESSMGRLLLNMAELHVQGDAPIKRLIQGLADFAKELQEGVASENSAYETKRADHQGKLQSLSSRIGEAKGEISARQSRINTVLNPRISQANSDIQRDTDTKAAKEEELKQATSTRAINHQGYLQRVDEHNAQIGAIDEALPLLNGLKKSAPSLIQVRKVSVTLKSIHAKLARAPHTEVALIEALITLATNQNFVDQEILDKIIGEFTKLRKKLTDSLALEQNNEADEQKNFENFVKQTSAEIVDLGNNIKKNTVVITETEKEINEANRVIDDKTFEVQELTENVEEENESWRKETETHKSIIEEFNKEIDVVGQAQTLFQNAKFSDFVLGKLGN